MWRFRRCRARRRNQELLGAVFLFAKKESPPTPPPHRAALSPLLAAARPVAECHAQLGSESAGLLRQRGRSHGWLETETAPNDEQAWIDRDAMRCGAVRCVHVCVCVSNSVPKSLIASCRGAPNPTMWHSCPTTCNEAVDMSGKRELITLVYLHSHGSCMWQLGDSFGNF